MTHLYTVSCDSRGTDLGRTHQHAPRDIRSDSLPERLEAFLSGNSDQRINSVGIPKPLRRRLCPVGAHAYEGDFGWVAHDASDAAGDACTGNVPRDGYLAVACELEDPFGEQAVDAETGGGV